MTLKFASESTFIVDPFYPKDTHFLLVCLTFVVRTWLSKSQVGIPKMFDLERMWVALHVQLCFYPCCQLSALSSFCLPLGLALDPGRILSFALSLGTSLVPMGLFNTTRHMYCLSSSNLTIYLAGLFFLSSCLLGKWPNMKLIISA